MRKIGALILTAAVAGTVGMAAASNLLVSTWKAPGEGPMDMARKKVAALVITDDEHLRVSAEEALAREITARGPQGIPTYRIVPREETTDAQKVKGWYERTGVAGVVALRIVGQDKERVYSSVVWSSGYYNDFYNYYGSSWATVTPIGQGRIETTFEVETLMFRVSDAKLLWAGVSRTTDPKSVGAFMTELAKAVVAQLEKDGLRARPGKLK
jgi:hypothetical protein